VAVGVALAAQPNRQNNNRNSKVRMARSDPKTAGAARLLAPFGRKAGVFSYALPMADARIPFGMFDLRRSVEEARRAQKLASLYHRGQELAWDGRAVLAELIARHGGIHLPGGKRAALGQVFAVIMWGELAAWKISAQLADEIEELEPKLAATSQAHDEARHFYVMHDYLTMLGAVPREMDRHSRAVLDMVLRTRSLVKKLLGMQLMVESLALTIFQVVRENRIEPVLADLLRYFEKDEARHVGLGVQLLPGMLKGLGRLETASLVAFQLRILGHTLAGLKAQEAAWKTLGVHPMELVMLGRAKQTLAFQHLADQMHLRELPRSRELMIRGVKGVAGALFSDEPGMRARARAFVDRWRESLDEGLRPTALHPDEPAQVVTVRRP
jgi:hypothetical protein